MTKGGTKKSLTYKQSGVDYSSLDPFKLAAQKAATSTASNLTNHGYKEISESRGESAYVWDEGDKYRAMVTEGLGTKNLIADAVREFSDKSHYDQIAQDTVAMIVNDLIVVGAEPQVVTAHFSVGDSGWFNDKQRVNDLVKGWQEACNMAGATWGGGETPALKEIIKPGVIELSGSAIGEINPKNRLTLGEKLSASDVIILISSSGIHANGLTLARSIASSCPDGYQTLLPDGTTYDEALLEPTPIYAPAVKSLFEAGVDIHYMSNITGHGWRKLMRANKELTYKMTNLPKVQPIFEFIKEKSGNNDEEMYGNFNMGAGFAVFVAKNDADKAIATIAAAGFEAVKAGFVENGPKQVVIEPKGLVYSEQSLNVR